MCTRSCIDMLQMCVFAVSICFLCCVFAVCGDLVYFLYVYGEDRMYLLCVKKIMCIYCLSRTSFVSAVCAGALR